MSAPPPIAPDHLDRLPIVLRAYAEAPAAKPRRGGPVQRPSKWTLIFDTETTIDAGQALRFGAYQVRKGGALVEAGLFYRPEVLSADEIALLTAYAARHGLKLHSQASFIEEVFFGIGYELRATIVGFNLPFDLSRLAVRFGPARGRMRGGFTFALSRDKRWPHVQVKHLSGRASFIQFTAPFAQRAGRSDRKRGRTAPIRRGFFLDVNTLAHALFARPFSLSSLAEHLGTPAHKADTDKHGAVLTEASEAYMGYALQDVQVTWECYAELTRRYAKFGLSTPAHRIYSEASLGKAYLDAMGVRPWREVQPDVPPALLGVILSSYYGGRAEVRIRRERRQVVLCDFLSMYPTVCTLMGLWRFVIADGMTWRDDTDGMRTFLDRVTVEDLPRPEIWRDLTALVQVQAESDVFPVRAPYDASGGNTIGLNHLTCAEPIWMTLADCIASKLLTGHAPKVVRAMVFAPSKPQAGLRPVAISGNKAYGVAPDKDDFYRRLIELRQEVKGCRDSAPEQDRERLDAEQNALKIAANATSYGIFVEVNVTEPTKPRSVTVHTGLGGSFEEVRTKVEEPGRFFHPLLATLITGAARLMLAATERLGADRGLEWAFCDTDSMAIAKPGGMEEASFHEQVDAIVNWFEPLNPYAFGGSILKVEDVNKAVGGGARDALHCYAVSAKRYVLFNLDAAGRPVLRKASAHGLGHLRPPYGDEDRARGVPRPSVPFGKIGVELWQHDLWWTIANAASAGPAVQVLLDYQPALKRPAVSRYAATRPGIQRWFKRYNEGRPYDEQVKPFGFLLAFGARLGAAGQPVAPFDRDHARAVESAFDRHTGAPVEAASLASYRENLVRYHLRPEGKFLNGGYVDHGPTRRRHVHANGARHIGKEANRWEEQFFVGLDPEEEIIYDDAPNGRAVLVDELKRAGKELGERRLADSICISREWLRRLVISDGQAGSDKLWHAVATGLGQCRADQRREQDRRERVLSWLSAEIEREDLKAVATSLGYDPANLAKMRAGLRRVPEELIRVVEAAMAKPVD